MGQQKKENTNKHFSYPSKVLHGPYPRVEVHAQTLFPSLDAQGIHPALWNLRGCNQTLYHLVDILGFPVHCGYLPHFQDYLWN